MESTGRGLSYTRAQESLAFKDGNRATVFKTTGERYTGSWASDKKEGKGVLVYTGGNKYEGEFLVGKRHGQGVYWVQEDGKYRIEYNGEWANGRREGYGIFWSKNGDRYEGEWVGGKRNGKGRQTYGGRFPDGFGGDLYEGEWLNDKRHGLGFFEMANGDCYEGSWENGLKHGRGTYYYAGQSGVYQGVWANDVAKCGEYVNNPDVMSRALPVIDLESPADVLREAEDIAIAVPAIGGAPAL